MKRRLSLVKDTLTELTTDDLVSVQAGQQSLLQICGGPLSFADGCVYPTCGPGCTGKSDPLTR